MRIRFHRGGFAESQHTEKEVASKVELMEEVAKELGARPNNYLLNSLTTTLEQNTTDKRNGWAKTYTLWFVSRVIGFTDQPINDLPAQVDLETESK